MRWAEHVARIGQRRGLYRVLMGNIKERNHLGDPDVDGSIILRCVFRKWDVGVLTGLRSLRIGQVAGTCE